MFRKTNPQISLFEIDNVFTGIFPSEDWCYIYKEAIYPKIDEEKFRHLYKKTPTGQPNKSIKKMISLLIFMGLEKLTWRGAEFQFPRRIDWMIATNTEIGDTRIDHTTLFKFYQRLEKDETARNLFTELTGKFIKACGTSIKKQRTDSFFIHGWLQTLTRYGLFKETLRKFLHILRKKKPELYEGIEKELSKNYLDKVFDLTEKDKVQTQKRVSTMTRDLYKIVIAFENQNEVKHYETFKTLKQVFSEQCEVRELPNNDEPEIVIKEKPDKRAINTPHNTDAQYVSKVKQHVTGEKGFSTETCEPENKTQFITDVNVTEATKHDSTENSEIQERLIENDFKPEKQYDDAGFVNGKTIIESKEKEIQLEGPTAGRSQSFEAYNSDSRPLDAGDFETTCIPGKDELIIHKCPADQKPISQKRSEQTGKINVHFDPDICRLCSLKERCSVKIGKRVATYTVDEAEYIGSMRHHKYMGNKEYRKECATRAGAEAMVSEITRAHGMRKSRHRKRTRTKLQLIFAALACNVKRFLRHGQNYGYLVTEAA